MPNKPQIVFVSTFPPTQCGIATFTLDLFSMFKCLFAKNFDYKIIAMGRKGEKVQYKEDVLREIIKEKREDYIKSAKYINSSKRIALVSVQHEFGIFGGDLGSYLLYFLEEVKKPVVITFHSVIPNPEKKMLAITKKIASRVKNIVVMTNHSKKILINDYKISSKKISVIPHGIHSFPYEETTRSKKKLGFLERKILLTFGLLSPNKGIEYVIESLGEVVKKYPEVLYIVVGATHPMVKKLYGEKYRNSLQKRVRELKIDNNVKFVNSYQSLDNLILYLKSSDIYISTSLDENQAVSGTFSYALGAGRPVVSTNFSQAREALSKETGIMVSTKSPAQYSAAILDLLKSKKKRNKMGTKAYFTTRNMTWQNVSLSYQKIFTKYLKKVKKIDALPPVSVSHILKMTDSFAMFQFAKLSDPDPESGYTVDDNARAMIALALYFDKSKNEKVLKYIKRYLKFLKITQGKNGFFQNYMDKNKNFIAERNSTESPEDPTSRALYALSRVYSLKSLPLPIRKMAKQIFQTSIQNNLEFTHSRSISFYIKALHFFLKVEKNQKLYKELVVNADILMGRFQRNYSVSWKWLEEFLAYSNGIIPEALLLAFKTTKNRKYFLTAIKASDFLILNSFSKKMFAPVGQNGWFQKGGEKRHFDQQPEEATSMVELTKRLYEITKDPKYKSRMFQAYNWFLGGNVLNQFVYDCASGGCYDGIGETEVNLNQGAESTVSYLIARLTVER